MKSNTRLSAVVCSVLLLACLCGCSKGNNTASETQGPGVKEAVSDAVDVYLYGYPLVTMDMTRKRMTNVAMADSANAPLGQLVRMRTYPAVDYHAVAAPNADTLYTTAWIDVSHEPWVFSIPDMGDRYYLMQMLDGWTEVFQNPGKRTTGGKAQKYAITGPGWSGTLPTGVTEYKSPTGLVPGRDFDPSKLGAFDKEAIKPVPKLAQVEILEYFKKAGVRVNGWMSITKTGIYGTDYLHRALITAIGLGANRPQDAVYPLGEKDGNGNDFDAASKKYVMHFDKGQMPPVNGFWSLTMYDATSFFVPNSLNRYTLSSRNTFVTNPDGSVDLYLQADSPVKAKEANWLPAPRPNSFPC
jgi:hypothetical protein